MARRKLEIILPGRPELGVEFINETGGGRGVRFRKPTRQGGKYEKDGRSKKP
jgi:hypothetical protein